MGYEKEKELTRQLRQLEKEACKKDRGVEKNDEF